MFMPAAHNPVDSALPARCFILLLLAVFGSYFQCETYFVTPRCSFTNRFTIRRRCSRFVSFRIKNVVFHTFTPRCSFPDRFSTSSILLSLCLEGYTFKKRCLLCLRSSRAPLTAETIRFTPRCPFTDRFPHVDLAFDIVFFFRIQSDIVLLHQLFVCPALSRDLASFFSNLFSRRSFLNVSVIMFTLTSRCPISDRFSIR